MRNDYKKWKMYIFLGLSILLIAVSIMAPVLAPHNPAQTDMLMIRVAPNAIYPLGTDHLGRCVLSRVLYGARTSIFSALLLVVLSFFIGSFVGLISGYYGGKLDDVIMRIVDVLLAFPQMVLAVAVAGILGGSLMNAMLATGITSWTSYARLARSHTMSLKNEAFISAAKLNRCSDYCILKEHIFPNISGSLIINASNQIGFTMMSIAGLSFLGLGVTPPATEWGSMINEARSYMQLAPWAVFAPSIAILITIMVFNYLGDSIRDYYNE